MALRKQQDEEIHASQQMVAQRAALERAEAAHQKAAARLKELQASALDGSGARLLESLTDIVASLRFQARRRRLRAAAAARARSSPSPPLPLPAVVGERQRSARVQRAPPPSSPSC